MEPIQQKQNLKHLSIEARHQTKLQFFGLYEKYGNVAKCARDLGIASSTATVWVREYKANGKKVVKEKRHGRKKGDGRTLTEQQEKELLRMIVDKTPLQYKFKFALWNAKAVIHDSPSKKVVLIVDNLRIHHAKIVRAWAARHTAPHKKSEGVALTL